MGLQYDACLDKCNIVAVFLRRLLRLESLGLNPFAVDQLFNGYWILHFVVELGTVRVVDHCSTLPLIPRRGPALSRVHYWSVAVRCCFKFLSLDFLHPELQQHRAQLV